MRYKVMEEVNQKGRLKRKKKLAPPHQFNIKLKLNYN